MRSRIAGACVRRSIVRLVLPEHAVLALAIHIDLDQPEECRIGKQFQGFVEMFRIYLLNLPCGDTREDVP